MEISKDIKLRVIGVGKVGMSIVQAFAQSEFNVVGVDINADNLKTGLERVKANLDYLIGREKITPDQKDAILNRMNLSSNLDDLKDADVVIESVFEDMELKKKVFKELDKNVQSDDALLLTNTSSLCVSEISSATRRPENVAGMHFFNPVPVMKLVEIVRGVETSDATVNQVSELGKLLGHTIIVSKDSPGFIVNRILNALTMEACRIVEEGVGTIEDVDTGLKLGLGHPMGPFELFHKFDGIPLLVHVCEYMEKELSDRFRPPRMGKKLCKSGENRKKQWKRLL